MNPFVGVHAKASADAEGPIAQVHFLPHPEVGEIPSASNEPVNGNVGERAISPDFHRPQRQTQDRP
ncbi:MAG: hypothetical protein NHB14_16780 [Desulfosporosinus sp.]|nr:hypothetical protein [Desulfosporosinus sp.]